MVAWGMIAPIKTLNYQDIIMLEGMLATIKTITIEYITIKTSKTSKTIKIHILRDSESHGLVSRAGAEAPPVPPTEPQHHQPHVVRQRSRVSDGRGRAQCRAALARCCLCAAPAAAQALRHAHDKPRAAPKGGGPAHVEERQREWLCPDWTRRVRLKVRWNCGSLYHSIQEGHRGRAVARQAWWWRGDQGPSAALSRAADVAHSSDGPATKTSGRDTRASAVRLGEPPVAAPGVGRPHEHTALCLKKRIVGI